MFVIKKLICFLLAAFFTVALFLTVGQISENGPSAESPKAEGLEKKLGEMTLSEKIYQLMFVTPESITGVGEVIAAGETTREALSDYPVGGIIYFSANLKTKEQTVEMIKSTQSFSEIPLFIGVDEEGGRVSRAGSNPKMGVTHFSPMASVSSEEEAYSIGFTLGEELSALGINVDFAPVADVLVNVGNSEIGDRSFGSDPYHVSRMVSSEVKGFSDAGMCSVLKHFPGHGSTSVNSHNGKSESGRTLDELKSCELLPFISGIDAGADFVMVSHMTISSVSDKPASLSYEIITEILKGELGFSGLVITDSLSMGAVTEEYDANDAALTALEAGADMLLMPKNPKGAHDAILNAVNTCRLSEERIDESVAKILKVKENMNITKGAKK